jgi:hypothetical protein
MITSSVAVAITDALISADKPTVVLVLAVTDPLVTIADEKPTVLFASAVTTTEPVTAEDKPLVAPKAAAAAPLPVIAASNGRSRAIGAAMSAEAEIDAARLTMEAASGSKTIVFAAQPSFVADVAVPGFSAWPVYVR